MLIIKYILNNDELKDAFSNIKNNYDQTTIGLDDFEVEEYIKHIVDKYNKSSAKNYISETLETIEFYENLDPNKYELIYISQETVLNEIRIHIKNGNLNYKEVIMLYINKKGVVCQVNFDKNSRLNNYPSEIDFFGSQLDKIIDWSSKWQKKRIYN